MLSPLLLLPFNIFRLHCYLDGSELIKTLLHLLTALNKSVGFKLSNVCVCFYYIVYGT